MKILAFSPHSDDVEQGAGGYLTRRVAEGHDVFVVLVIAKDEISAHAGTRINEFRASMDCLGVRQHDVIYNERSHFDICLQPRFEIVGKFDEIIQGFEPDQVLLPVPSFHQEHQLVYDVGVAATRPTKPRITKEVLAYEYPAASWGPSGGLNMMQGATYVDISHGSYFENKLQSLTCHVSQNLHRSNDLVSMEAIKVWARMRGFEVGVKYAELLYTLRSVI